jgi:hypothetical protein
MAFLLFGSGSRPERMALIPDQDYTTTNQKTQDFYTIGKTSPPPAASLT